MKMLNAPDFAAGEKITEEGVYSGIHLDRYHSDLCDAPSVSSSPLRTILAESPADAFLTSPYNPNRKEGSATPAMIFGRAAHHLLLGEKEFRRTFTITPAKLGGEDWNGRTKICRNWIAEQERAGLVVLSPNDLEHIKGMADALDREPLIKAGLLRGKPEQSMFIRDPQTKLWVKTRPDVVPYDDGYADVKTASSVSTEAIDRAIDDYGYHVQAAMVGWLHRVLSGRDMQHFMFVFIKSRPPYSVAFRECKPSDIQDGYDDARIALRVFAHCLKTGNWFGPAGSQNDARFVNRKPWAIEQAKFRRGELKREIESWTKKPITDQA